MDLNNKLRLSKHSSEESSKDSGNPNAPPLNFFSGSNTPQPVQTKRDFIECSVDPTFGDTKGSARPLQISSIPKTQNFIQEICSDRVKTTEVKASKAKISMCSTIFLILPISFNGATISLLAYQFHLVGVALGAIIFLLAAMICVFAGYLIMETSYQVNATSYHELAQLTIGKLSKERICGKCVATISAVLNCICLLGASVAGVVFNKNVASSAMKGLAVPEIMKNNQVWAAAIIIVLVMPPLTFPRVSGIKYISYFTSALCVLYAGVALWGLFEYKPPKIQDVTFFNLDFQNIQIAFTLFLYPLLFQPNIQTVFQEMQRPTVRRTTLTLILDSFVVYVTYLLIGIMGYLSFASTPQLKDQILTCQNIFKTSGYAETILNKIYSLLFLSTTLTLILSCLFPVKMMILEFLKHKGSRTCKWNFIASLILCIVLCGFSLAINKTSIAIRAIGVTCYPTMCFVLPSLFYLSLDKGENTCRIKTTKVFAWLLLILVLGFIVSGVLDMAIASN